MTIEKAGQHRSQTEAFIFDRSQTERVGCRLPTSDVEDANIDDLISSNLRGNDYLLACATELNSATQIDTPANAMSAV